MGFGQSKSKNEVDSTTNILYKLVNSVVQTCTTNVNQNQIQNFHLSGNSQITGSTIGQNEVSIMDPTCTQSSNTKNTVNSTLQDKVQQLSKSVSSTLGLSKSKSANVTKYVQNLATAISNTYNSTCAAAISSGQTQNFTLTDNSKITGSVITQNQTATDLQKCFQSSNTVNQAKSNLQQAIGQTSSAKSSIFPNIPVWGIVLVIIGVLVFIIIIAIIIYFLV